jgi:hypothetical protein
MRSLSEPQNLPVLGRGSTQSLLQNFPPQAQEMARQIVMILQILQVLVPGSQTKSHLMLVLQKVSMQGLQILQVLALLKSEGKFIIRTAEKRVIDHHHPFNAKTYQTLWALVHSQRYSLHLQSPMLELAHQIHRHFQRLERVH